MKQQRSRRLGSGRLVAAIVASSLLAAGAAGVSKAQQIRTASVTLLLNIYKPDCTTPAQPADRKYV